MTRKLGLYLLSYKRPIFIQETIESILSQDYENFDLIISENSPDDLVLSVLQKYAQHPKVRILKRAPSLPSLEHFNTILKEAVEAYPYVMLFHDDDTMNPHALQILMTAIESDTNLSAVSSNAYIIKERNLTTRLFNLNLNRDTKVKDLGELIKNYIFNNHTAFPTYIYRTQHIKDLTLNPYDGGKYSDVSFLIKTLERGPFLWLSQPLFNYRLHGQNDSSIVNMNDITKLCRFYLQKSFLSFPFVAFFFVKQFTKKFILRSYRTKRST